MQAGSTRPSALITILQSDKIPPQMIPKGRRTQWRRNDHPQFPQRESCSNVYELCQSLSGTSPGFSPSQSHTPCLSRVMTGSRHAWISNASSLLLPGTHCTELNSMENILHILIPRSGSKLNIKTKVLRERWRLSAERFFAKIKSELIQEENFSHCCHDSRRAPGSLSQTVRDEKLHVIFPQWGRGWFWADRMHGLLDSIFLNAFKTELQIWSPDVSQYSIPNHFFPTLNSMSFKYFFLLWIPESS